MKIAYLLHRFPVKTDTFIRREIRSLQAAGTDVRIVSVWRPSGAQTTPKLMEEWAEHVGYLLPQSPLSAVRTLIATAVLSPVRFLAAVRLAYTTSRAGVGGLFYQMFYLAEAMLAADRIRRSSVQHIHNHFGDHSGIVTMLASKLSGVDYSISFHGPHVFFDAGGAALKEKVRRARFIRCISYYCRSQLIALCGDVGDTPLEIVHCGLDLTKYQFRLPRKEVRQIFCAARLAPEKGIIYLVEAMAQLASKNHDVHLRLAGDGPSRAAIEDAARKSGILERVTFLGNLSEDEVARELASCDVFVLPSLAEGVPVSVMEAMAVGVPVIATNVAGTSELVENGKSGILVRPTDSRAIAGAVIALMEDHEFRCRAAELGRANVVDEFDVVKETARLRECFMQCADGCAE